MKSTTLGLPVAITFLSLIVSVNSCTQKSNVVWLDELDIASFDEGIR